MANNDLLDPWISTYSGKQYHYFDPKPEMICIEDIAHALSNTCRFTGHVASFYSVAEHSIHAAHHVAPELRKFALLHDATEAYLVDIPRPLKQYLHIMMGPSLVSYKTVEEATMLIIAEALGFAWRNYPQVKVVDNRLLATEWRALLGSQWGSVIPGGIAECGEPFAQLQDQLETGTMSPREAEKQFLQLARNVLA